MTLWQRWKQTALHNKALVLSGFIVAFGTLFYTGAAIVQVCMFNRSSRQAERQTDKLIKAADQNASAADKFAASAEGIKQQAQSTVEQFRIIAGGTQKISETTRRAQGAFVYPAPDSIKGTAKGTKGTIGIDWENSGPTPANVEYRVNYIPPKAQIIFSIPFPVSPRRIDYCDWGESILAPIAAKGGRIPVQLQGIEDLEHLDKLYLYGWARYYEEGRGAQRHVTKFCYEVKISHAPLRLWPPNEPNEACGDYNCVDDQCKNDSQPKQCKPERPAPMAYQ